MMKNRRPLLHIVLALLAAALCACRPVPDGGQAGPDSPAAVSSEDQEKGEAAPPQSVQSDSEGQPLQREPACSEASQPSGASEAGPPVIDFFPSSQGEASPPSASLSEPEIPASAGGSGREGSGLLEGKDVSLLEWQWVDTERLALLAYYADADETLLLLYSKKGPAVKMLARLSGKPEKVEAPFYEEQTTFYLDGHSLSIDRENEQAEAGPLWEEEGLLPEEDEEYDYQGASFSSSGKYFFYERFPKKYRGSSIPASDRLLISHRSSAFEYSPAGEIFFPFDVRVTPKRALWLNGNDRLLVEADLPQKEQYDVYQRTYYVYSTSGQALACFPMEEGLTLRDSRRNLLLFERSGECYELLCYDYASGKSRSVVKLERENRPFGAARFSPDGKEIALLRPATDLTPQFYPLPSME